MKLPYLISLLILFSCSGTDEKNPDAPSFFVAVYSNSMNGLPINTALFHEAFVEGTLNYSDINEASGLAVSRQSSDYLWTHNDRGDINRIFLIHKNGTHLGSFRLLGTTNRDWEDIAIGRGPSPGVNYLYIGDIGDNNAAYAEKHIYRIPEPDVSLANNQVNWVDLEGAERIRFVYPEGKRMDAETLMIDPLTLDLYIVTKREFPVTVYRLPYPQSTTQVITAEKYGTLPFTMATGGDISSLGTEIIIKTRERVFLWTRSPTESISDAFMREPFRLPYQEEPQGEAIAFDEEATRYFTLSEVQNNITPKVYSYTRK